MPTLKKLAPVFPVSKLDAAIEHYRELGFTVTPYEDGGYAFAVRDAVEIHLTTVTGAIDLATTTSAAYLYVDDADKLAAEWARANVKGRLVEPVNTGYGTREGAHIDPDGNLLRFGSELK